MYIDTFSAEDTPNVAAGKPRNKRIYFINLKMMRTI